MQLVSPQLLSVENAQYLDDIVKTRLYNHIADQKSKGMYTFSVQNTTFPAVMQATMLGSLVA